MSNGVINIGSGTTASTTISGMWITSNDYISPAGSEVTWQATADVPDGPAIPPLLCFRIVKSKFSKIDQDELSFRFNKLSKMIMATKEVNQQALYEQLSIQLAIVIREQEALVAGCAMRLSTDVIDKFIGRVKGRCIKFKLFDEFPRIVPKQVRETMKRIQDLDIFDKYHVLYTDYSDEDLKTNKTKIKEKDPILFGSFDFSPKVLYYITDWVDKYCDLTMTKLISEIQVDDNEFELDRIPDITDDYISKIMDEVKERKDRLDETKQSNYRQLMAEEDKKNKKKKKKTSIAQTITDALRGSSR